MAILLRRGIIPAPATVYVGPGDIVSGATAWWGLRAYSMATAGSAAINLRASGDNATSDFSTLSTGALDVASIAAFQTAHGGSLFVTTLYDQTGNGNDMAQGTTANQPQLQLNVLGSLPAMSFGGSAFLRKISFASTLPQPWTLSAVADRTGSTSAYNSIITGSSTGMWFPNVADAMELEGPTAVRVTSVVDNLWHAAQGIANGVNSFMSVDGSTTGPSSGGTATFPSGTADVFIGSDNAGPGDPMNGFINEAGVWPIAFSAGQIVSINSNQHTYWAF